MKETWWFITGQSQWMPKWMEKLPKWMHPIYQGNYTFKWFGIEIKVDSRPGETLMMCWQRLILTRIYLEMKHTYLRIAAAIIEWLARKPREWHL